MATIKKGLKKAQSGSKVDTNTRIQKAKLDNKYNTIYKAMQKDSIKESNKEIPTTYKTIRSATGKSPSAEELRDFQDFKNKSKVRYSKKTKGNTKLDAKGRADNAMKNFKNGGSLSSLNASTKRDKGIDPKGAYTTVQKKTLAGAKGKAKLTADKQLGATKMAKRGMKISKKK